MLQGIGVSASPDRAAQAIDLIKERASFVPDLLPLTERMFVPPVSYDQKSADKFWKSDNVSNLRALRAQLEAMPELRATEAEAHVQQWVRDNQLPMGALMNTLRLAVIGVSQGPSIFGICAFIGKEETLRRIDAALSTLGDGRG